MNADDKLARQRRDLLYLGHAIGNISEACRQRGVSRTQFYVYKRRFQENGLEGLKDRPPVHKSHPFTTPDRVEDIILESSLEHPDWGCGRLSAHLNIQGILVSSPTIQRILIKHAMGRRHDRQLKSDE
mgnify:CR=1 FL=1